MANLPTIYDSNVTTKKSSLDKILPMMAKDIGIIKSNFVKLIQQQTGQRAKSEAFFAKALQRENMYESQYGKRSGSSPSKVGSDKKGMLFDPKVGVFDFIKGFLNNILKGMVVGGGAYGLAKAFDNPEFRKTLSEFFTNLFTALVKGIEGAANFLSDLTKSDKFRNAVVESFVAISDLFINSLSMIKDVLTDDRVIKSIKDVAANLIKTIGDVLKTEVDLGKVGPINVGKHSLGSILATVIASMAAFRVALIIATGRLLAIGAGYKGGVGGAGGRGGRGGRGGKGIGGRFAGPLAILGAYEISKQGGAAVSQALDDWAQKHLDEKDALQDDDSLMDSMEQGQQGSNVSSASPTQTNKEESFISGLDPVEAALLGYGGYQISKDLISKGNEIRANRKAANAAKASAGKPTPKTGFPRGPLSNVTPTQPQSKIIPQRAGSGARDYERMRSMGQAAEGMYSGKRAPLPPQEQGMVKKIGEYLSKIWKKGLWSKLTTFLMKKMGMAAALRFITVAGAWVAGTAASGGLLGPALAALGYALLAYDIYMIYEYVKQFWEEESGESTSPTPTTTPPKTTSPSQTFKDEMTRGANKNRNESIDSSDARSLAEKYLGRKMDDNEWNMLVRATYAEGSGKSVDEYASIMAVILNRARKSGGRIQDVLYAKNQFQSVTGTKDNPTASPRFKSGPGQRDLSMITEGSGLLEAISPNLDAFTAANRAAYGKGTSTKWLDKLLASGGKTIGGTVFAENMYRPSSTSLAAASPRISGDSITARNWMAEDAKRNANAAAGVNIINSYNTNNADTQKQNNNLSSAPVASPFNEEQFFEAMVKSIFI